MLHRHLLGLNNSLRERISSYPSLKGSYNTENIIKFANEGYNSILCFYNPHRKKEWKQIINIFNTKTDAQLLIILSPGTLDEPFYLPLA